MRGLRLTPCRASPADVFAFARTTNNTICGTHCAVLWLMKSAHQRETCRQLDQPHPAMSLKSHEWVGRAILFESVDAIASPHRSHDPGLPLELVRVVSCGRTACAPLRKDETQSRTSYHFARKVFTSLSLTFSHARTTLLLVSPLSVGGDSRRGRPAQSSVGARVKAASARRQLLSPLPSMCTQPSMFATVLGSTTGMTKRLRSRGGGVHWCR